MASRRHEVVLMTDVMRMELEGVERDYHRARARGLLQRGSRPSPSCVRASKDDLSVRLDQEKRHRVAPPGSRIASAVADRGVIR